MRLLNPQREGLAEPCCFSQSWLRIREANGLHLDESGWLFLGGSVATGACLRFASRKNSCLRHAFTWIDLACLENAASSCVQAAVLLKVLPVDRQQIPHQPARHFEGGSVVMAFGQLGFVDGPQRRVEMRS